MTLAVVLPDTVPSLEPLAGGGAVVDQTEKDSGCGLFRQTQKRESGE